MGIKSIMACAATFATFLMMPVAAHAQPDRQSASLQYGISIPAGNGFIDKAGFVNLSVEYDFRLMSMLSAGFSLGYGYDSQKGHTEDRYNGDFVSGFSDRKLSVIPMLIQFRITPWEQWTYLEPYLIVGAGMQYARFDIVGDQIDRGAASNWAAAFMSQIGLRFFPVADKKFYMDARFSWNYAGNEWKIMNVESIQRIGVSLGLGIKF